MKYIYILALLVFGLTSCDVPSGDQIDVVGTNQSVALPLIDSDIRVVDLTTQISGGKTSVKVGDDGKISVLYSGNLIGFNSTTIFPPIPGIFDNVLPDTASALPLPIKAGHRITKAIFKNTNMSFRFRSETPGTYKVKITIPDVVKDNQVWIQDYTIVFLPGQTEIITSRFLLNGWTVTPQNNLVTFIYDARDEEGNRVKFDYGAMLVDVLEFGAIEGYFGSSPFDIAGDFININLFDRWISGGLALEDPKITLEVQNSFGFPVRSKVNKLDFKTKSGAIFPLESQYITDGIYFEHPTLNEMGQVKTTYFSFDKNNSNIKQIFNDKIVQVDYDIDALPNPDFDETVTNFLDDESFFKVNVDVEIPMYLRADEFVIGDTIDFDISPYENVKDATFKSIVKNGFPVDMEFQGYFLDDNGNRIDSLFSPNPLSLIGPDLDGNGKALPGIESVQFIEVSEDRFDNIRTTHRLLMTAKINNTDDNLRWLFEDYAIRLKLGVIINFKD